MAETATKGTSSGNRNLKCLFMAEKYSYNGGAVHICVFKQF